MSSNEKRHSGAAGGASQQGNLAAGSAPADADLAGSAGNSGNGGDGGDASAAIATSAASAQDTEASSGGTHAISKTHADQAGVRSGTLIPPVDVIEDANGITLLADIPGVSRDKLDLRLETNSLTIKAAVSLDVPQEMASRYAEVEHQQYQRSFALSRELDGEQASAELAHGVLKIRIPKTAHAQSRKVQIKVA